MNKREACLILGLRDSAADDKIKDAHRRIMIANHPDAGMKQYARQEVMNANLWVRGPFYLPPCKDLLGGAALAECSAGFQRCLGSQVQGQLLHQERNPKALSSMHHVCIP